jgi:hypothetical protein
MTKLLGGALGIATEVARHLVWYVRHQLHGDPRDRD